MSTDSIVNSTPLVTGESEEWRDIPGFPLYQVSNLGRVRTRRPWGPHERPRRHWHVLKPWANNRGYLSVALCRVSHERGVNRLIHRLVLEAFVGPCPPGMEARHLLSNDVTDNRLCNLSWGTRSQNQGDRVAHGTDRRGSRHYLTRLTEDDVRRIRELSAAGARGCDLARQFNQRPENILKICRRLTWRHLP